MKQAYKECNFRSQSRALIVLINQIIEDYVAMGYRLTVRQIYYQCIARDILPDSWIDEEYNRKHGLPPNTKNTQKNYDKLQELLNEGRLAGQIDWDAIEDRTRSFARRNRWTSASAMLDDDVGQFHMDPWTTQDIRVFCVVEKEALQGVLERTCQQWDVPLLAARGYPSASVLREFAETDLARYRDQNLFILHLGDHDPSGLDMTRDLTDRLRMFCEPEGIDFELIRLALNMNQIKAKKPPPNPAKVTDSRYEQYRRKYGDKSWELDALDPTFLNALLGDAIKLHLNAKAWKKRSQEIETQRDLIRDAAERMRP